jgi:hypothetical protein
MKRMGQAARAHVDTRYAVENSVDGTLRAIDAVHRPAS